MEKYYFYGVGGGINFAWKFLVKLYFCDSGLLGET